MLWKSAMTHQLNHCQPFSVDEMFHASLSIDWGKKKKELHCVLQYWGKWLQPRGRSCPWVWNECVSEACHIKTPWTKACTYSAVDNASWRSIPTMNLAIAHFDGQLKIWGYDYIFLSNITKATCDFFIMGLPFSPKIFPSVQNSCSGDTCPC